MCHILPVLALVLGTVRLAPAAPVPPEVVPPEVLRAVKDKLPKGWTATAQGVTLTIRREKKVSLFNFIGRPPSIDGRPPAPARTEVYEITLTFRPRVTAEAFERMERENAEIQKKLDKLRDGLRDAGIRHKFDEWLPGTPEQKKLVADYRAAQKAMPYHRLPDYFTATSSIDLYDSVHFALTFTDADEAKECRGVKESVRGLFRSHARE